jgi:hypothetical protein
MGGFELEPKKKMKQEKEKQQEDEFFPYSYNLEGDLSLK